MPPLEQLKANVQKLNFSGWLIGLLRAVISGGANAVVSVIVVPQVVGPLDLKRMVTLAACTFGFAAFIDLMKFLATHPTPDYTEPMA
jgi:hypothetical protein